jgi:hypothetical protein
MTKAQKTETKSAKPTKNALKDLTVKQYKQALARNGMEFTQDGNLDTISVYGFELTGKNRRAKLANAIARKTQYEAEQVCDRFVAEVAEVFTNARVVVSAPATRVKSEPVLNKYGEQVELSGKVCILCSQRVGIGTEPIVNDKNENVCIHCWKPEPGVEPDYAALAAEAKAPKTAHTCPDCGAEIPPRYRVCDSCLEKRRTAKKAAKPVPAA